jgi:cyclopropane fatty-acyl-phospholipid synthase-like methyltransferase
MRDMYETDLYHVKNPTWHEGDAPWKARQIEKMITRRGLTPRTVCEVGCGTGDILLTLEQHLPDASLVGYDIAPQAIERASAKATARTTFRLADVLEEPDLRFDLVLAIDVLEHVDDYLGFLKRLRPLGAHTIFHIPLDLSAQSVARGWPILGLREDVGHLHYFFKETALETLRDCGFAIVDHCYTASRLELPNQALSSRLMKLPRRAMFGLNQDLTVRLLGGFSLLVLAT